ncbi:unknown [Alistipes sp. CAG:514]|nr:unknown [Alistipes sp. CAG:514]
MKRLSTTADRIASRTPRKYIPKRARAELCGKKAPASRTKIGSLPAQDMNGMMAIVMRRLLRLSIARVAMIAGTLQPKPITIGMKDLP